MNLSIQVALHENRFETKGCRVWGQLSEDKALIKFSKYCGKQTMDKRGSGENIGPASSLKKNTFLHLCDKKAFKHTEI